LYRDYPATELQTIETRWAEAREEAAMRGIVAGLAPLEHSHWDWRKKADSVEIGRHMLVAVECAGEPQGIMAVLRTPGPARLVDGNVIYVDYVESAPWNIKSSGVLPRYLGVGTALIAEAVRLGLESGTGGRVGLHSLPQAEAFYDKCGMTRLGPDVDYFDLTYYEFTDQQATNWLQSIGAVP
jgi:GNAT superfamily N-acetyltransferase